MPENTACRFQLELHRIQLFEKNESISSCRRFASDSVSLPRLDNPTGACPTHRRQWADFLVSLMAPLHRQYKTARTETRWHLLLKTWQMPIQTSASRGYVLLSGGTRGTHKSPKIVCWLADTVRGVFQTWKDTDHRRCKSRLVRNAAFFEQNVSYAFQLKSTDKLSIILLITSKRNSLFGIVCLNEKRV